MSTSVTMTSGPWDDSVGMSEANFSSMVSDWFDNGGVHSTPAGIGLKAFGDSTGMQVKVNPGHLTWNGQWAALTTQAVIDIPANATGLRRIDRIIARRDSTANTITIMRWAGTPLSLPVPTAVTGEDVLIAQVSVPSGAVTIAATSVIDERAFFPVGTTHTIVGQEPVAPYVGQQIYAQDVDEFQHWDGSLWQQHYNDRPPQKGTATVTPDINGNVGIPHTLGVIPSSYNAMLLCGAGGNLFAANVAVRQLFTTSATLRVFKPDGTPFSGSGVTIYWVAYP